MYDKNVRKRSWSKAGQASQTVAKPGLTYNKVMLCVWWDWKGIIHYELLPAGRITDSKLYCEQLMRLKHEGVESMRLPDFLPVHPGRTSPEPEHQDEQLQQIISELERTRSELFTERRSYCRASSGYALSAQHWTPHDGRRKPPELH
ncbi:jg9798 [Pararge aegeria aegeria]|uniref:Jg9798 protein n=1 Tax=Pararge aegeria aegeria TaxID=348720 RepID=A0A8S4RJA1_9NEOP|nr:jg9798 [Pararge aegeria aegeria]